MRQPNRSDMHFSYDESFGEPSDDGYGAPAWPTDHAGFDPNPSTPAPMKWKRGPAPAAVHGRCWRLIRTALAVAGSALRAGTWDPVPPDSLLASTA